MFVSFVFLMIALFGMKADLWDLFWVNYILRLFFLILQEPALIYSGYVLGSKKRWMPLIVAGTVAYLLPIVYLLSNIVGIGTQMLAVPFALLLVFYAVSAVWGYIRHKKKK